MNRKWIAITLLIAAVSLSACGATSGSGDRRSDNSAAEPTPLPTTAAAARPMFEVKQGSVRHSLNFNGRVVPIVEQALAFDLDGVAREIYVERFDFVQEGDLLAELDTSGWEGEMVLARSALEIAQSQLDTSQREIDTARRRAELSRDLARLDWEYAVAQGGETPSAEQQHEIGRLALLLDLAELDVSELGTTVDPELAAEVDAAALRVAELEAILSRATLVAPFVGVISALNMAQGRAVVAGESVGALADLSELEVSASLREFEMEELTEGMRVQIVPLNQPGDPLHGTIRQLPFPFGTGGGDAAGAAADPSTRIQFDDMAQALERYDPLDRVDLAVLVAQEDDTLWLPTAAIRDFNGRTFVVIDSDGVQQRQDVTLGISGEGRIEIVEGLETGQIIVGQ